MKIIIAGVLTLALTTTAIAAPRVIDPNWPCQQVKVASLSFASVWSGPAVGLPTAKWEQNEPAMTLVPLIAQRRLPLDQAVHRISDFSKTLGTDRKQVLLDVLSGVFATLDNERTNVLNGLDRFGQRQKVLADDLRQNGEALRAAQASTPPDDATIHRLTEQLLWKQQVFQARRDSLHYACDIPSIIEQRLYGVSKAIEHLVE